MKDYLTSLLRPLLEKPDALEITESTDDMGLLFSIRVDLRDMGYIVGKEGATAKAIRKMAKMYSVRSRIRASVLLLEPHGSTITHKPTEHGTN